VFTSLLTDEQTDGRTDGRTRRKHNNASAFQSGFSWRRHKKLKMPPAWNWHKIL